MTTLLIDGDTYAYKAALGAEKVIEDFDGDVVQRYADMDEARATVDREIDNVLARFSDDHARLPPYKLALTGSTNFRKDIFATYKSKRGPKPMALKAVRQHLLDTHSAVIKEGLEADDVVGIWATHPKLVPGDKIVVSPDKDLRSIPGKLWTGRNDDDVMTISASAANYNHLAQALTGDTTDCYPGCPKVGPVKASAILQAFVDDKGGFNVTLAWLEILKAFEKAGLTEADALVQARVARILRATDYDYKKKEPILWTPPQASVKAGPEAASASPATDRPNP